MKGEWIPPHSEATPQMTDDGTIFGEPNSFNPKLNKIIQSEADVFRAHPNATHVRYGAIYGPNNILPVMWSVVKRLLDGRTRIVVNPTSRLPRANECFGRNAAEYFLLAVDNPGSQGEAFNGLEGTMPTTVQWIHMVAEARARKKRRLMSKVNAAKQKAAAIMDLQDDVVRASRLIGDLQNEGLITVRHEELLLGDLLQ